MKKNSNVDRNNTLKDFENWWEAPIRILGVVWLILLVYELLIGTNVLIAVAVYIIWGIFIFDFLARFVLSVDKTVFLKSNIFTAISLIIPALRFLTAFRAFRLFRITRSLRLATLIGSLNRGMRVFRSFLSEHHTGYVILFSIVVTFVGASGMYAFERGYPGSTGFDTFGDSLWWTAMILTTVGSQAWPVSPEGRLLCFLISLYSFGVLGFITAAIASFLVGKK